MTKVLVTGGHSFTGQHLIPILDSAGYETHSLSLTYSPGTGVNHVGDITDVESLNTVIKNVEPKYIIHLAGISFAAHPRPLELYNINLLGTENLLRAAYDNAPQIQRVILASSANVYGSADSTYLDEKVCPSPVNHYASSKLAMEHMAKTWMEKLPITIVRPFNYTGPGQDQKFLIPKIISHFAKNASEIELGNIQISRDFTDVRIICQYYTKLLTAKKSVGKTVNLCSGRLISLQQILDDVSEISGHSIDVKINQDFVRDTDIMELRGNPTKLYSLIGSQTHPPMHETLAWMFKESMI